MHKQDHNEKLKKKKKNLGRKTIHEPPSLHRERRIDLETIICGIYLAVQQMVQ